MFPLNEGGGGGYGQQINKYTNRLILRYTSIYSCILKNLRLGGAPSHSAHMTGSLHVNSRIETSSQNNVIIWYTFITLVPKYAKENLKFFASERK